MVILDVWLQNSKLDGLGILQALHVEEPQIPVVMISGHGTIEMAVTAIQHGAYDFLEKPFQSDRLLLQARRALENARLARENAELRLRAGSESALTGESGAVAALRAGVERVAPHRLARADPRPGRVRQGGCGAHGARPQPPGGWARSSR